MKKLFSLAIMLFGIISFFGISMAACQQVTFSDNTSVCVDINKNGNVYTMSNGLNCPGSNCSLSCMIQLPDNTMDQIGACNGNFVWNGNNQGLLKIRVTLNGIQKDFSKNYNFSLGNWDGSTTPNVNTDLNNFYLSTNQSEPTTSQRTNLIIRARNNNNNTLTNFNGRVKFRVYYRSSINSSWTETTSSSYYNIDSSFNNGYSFSTYDNGEKTLNNFIRFNKNNHHYKVIAYDENNSSIQNEIVFYVGTTSNTNTNLANFVLSTNRSSPTTYQRADLTVRARNSSNSTLTNFNERVNFKVYYKNTSSSYWNETTSSNYYNTNFSNGYSFYSSDNGVKTLSNFIKFNKNNYDYKVRVYAENNPNIYNEMFFYVGTSTNSNTNLDNFLLSTNRSSPTTYQRADLTVRARNSSNSTLTNFNERVNFKVYYKNTSSSYWNETTSSSYYNINTNFSNGYSFYSSDNGVKTLSNFIKFNKNNYDYKVRVYSENNTNTYNEIFFYVGTSTNSTVNGFTVKEFEMIQRIYSLRPHLINQLKVEHPSFKTNTTWINLGNNLRSNMKDIIDNKSSRKFTNYSKFFTDFEIWFNRTMDVIH